MKDKSENFNVLEEGTKYDLPKYRVVDREGIKEILDVHEDLSGIYGKDTLYQKITFVRGDKEDNGKVIPRIDGITHEQLLGMMIHDLKYKNSLVPSRESSLAITKLEEALMWIEARQKNRNKRNVQGTYKK